MGLIISPLAFAWRHMHIKTLSNLSRLWASSIGLIAFCCHRFFWRFWSASDLGHQSKLAGPGLQVWLCPTKFAETTCGREHPMAPELHRFYGDDFLVLPFWILDAEWVVYFQIFQPFLRVRIRQNNSKHRRTMTVCHLSLRHGLDRKSGANGRNLTLPIYVMSLPPKVVLGVQNLSLPKTTSHRLRP